MSPERTDEELRKIRNAFAMPSVQTMIARKSSITNAFVNSLIPVIMPTVEEIEEALAILGMRHDDLQCAYCGGQSTEWDHLRPLVVSRRPTGYISEIGNLVPACGKCNQSKGNKYWLQWMTGNAPLSPRTRGVGDMENRIERLRSYEAWRPSVAVEFENIVGKEAYRQYWNRLDEVIDKLRETQNVADQLRSKIAAAHGGVDVRNVIEDKTDLGFDRVAGSK